MKKLKLILSLSFVAIAVLIFSSYLTLKAINNFFEKYELKFNRVLTIKVKPPVEIVERKKEVLYLLPEKVKKDLQIDMMSDIEKYICQKFGVANCLTAIAVAKAESGLQEDRYNINKNGTIDIGIFQINEVHWKKEGCKPKDLFDGFKNVDCAYQIWKVQGWQPWIAYKNGSYLKFISFK